MFSFYIFNISILRRERCLISINYEDNPFQRNMTKISKDPATRVTGRGDPRVLALLPAPTSGHHTQPLAVQEAEAGNGILFLLFFASSIIPVPEGCFEDKRKSKTCTVFMSEQMCDITPK